MAIHKTFGDLSPQVGDGVYLADTAVLIGDVSIGARSSVWFGAVLRGDVGRIVVGQETSIQDAAVIHATGGKTETHVGDRVTVGHHVTLHGCTVGAECIVGMGSILLDEVVLEPRCMVAAGSVVSPGTRIPEGTLAMGAPAKVRRDLTGAELSHLVASAKNYVELTRRYLAEP